MVAPKKELLRGMALALAVAGVILTIAVLPAESGIDPTGAGEALGLTALHVAAPKTVPGAVPAAAAPLAAAKSSTVSAPGEQRGLTIASKQAAPYRSDVRAVTLAPGRGVEVKTHLAKGATLVFSWRTANGELLNHDFHGEPVNAKGDEFESFIEENGVSQSNGALIAPFTGVHGWYWLNKTAAPVTLTLRASGFYTDIFKK
ncbi:hypothetical protein C7C56_009750 [Massilia glaciei]|uniref:Transmembrane anchor protein n=2 Tax=Massilia glaciei TaxID=1524097 RepID=A0A2U2HMZ3_9BURK|nr:hypothetical protein C7C56_009750 [Massilia glaciei]